jgi:L-threonylcarbamoyladenylate synthase
MYVYSTVLLNKVKQHLKAGGVIAYPTESCYGLGCDPFNYSAINKIIRLKGRSKSKGLIIIAGLRSQLHGVIPKLSAADELELKKYWPGFYSLILPANNKVLPNLVGKHQKIAVRVTQHYLVQQLCLALNMPLVSTSANKSGFRSIKSYQECERQFGRQVMVLPGRIGFAKRPSTIIDWQSGNILR